MCPGATPGPAPRPERPARVVPFLRAKSVAPFLRVAEEGQTSMSDETATLTATPDPAPSNGMGTFDEAGVYTPRQITMDDLGTLSLEDAISGTIVEFDDGDIVKGTVVKVDKDEVLLDIGFKSEGVIPARELSIRHDLDPHEVVSLGEVIEALVLQKEDKEGRLILSKKRAQYERA